MSDSLLNTASIPASCLVLPSGNSSPLRFPISCKNSIPSYSSKTTLSSSIDSAPTMKPTTAFADSIDSSYIVCFQSSPQSKSSTTTATSTHSMTTEQRCLDKIIQLLRNQATISNQLHTQKEQLQQEARLSQVCQHPEDCSTTQLITPPGAQKIFAVNRSDILTETLVQENAIKCQTLISITDALDRKIDLFIKKVFESLDGYDGQFIHHQSNSLDAFVDYVSSRSSEDLSVKNFMEIIGDIKKSFDIVDSQISGVLNKFEEVQAALHEEVEKISFLNDCSCIGQQIFNEKSRKRELELELEKQNQDIEVKKRMNFELGNKISDLKAHINSVESKRNNVLSSTLSRRSAVCLNTSEELAIADISEIIKNKTNFIDKNERLLETLSNLHKVHETDTDVTYRYDIARQEYKENSINIKIQKERWKANDNCFSLSPHNKHLASILQQKLQQASDIDCDQIYFIIEAICLWLNSNVPIPRLQIAI